MLSFSNYVCTKSDRAIIESTKKSPSSSGKEQLVLIDDVPRLKKHIKCLFLPYRFLYDKVIDGSHNTQLNIGNFNVICF
jgi:hypothetical protein